MSTFGATGAGATTGGRVKGNSGCGERMSVYTQELAAMLAKYGVNVPKEQIIEPPEKVLERAMAEYRESLTKSGNDMLIKAIGVEKWQKLSDLAAKDPNKAVQFMDSQGGIDLINVVIDDVITFLEN